MKKYLVAAFTIGAVLFTSFALYAPRQSAKTTNDVAELALMLPETDVIVALDMNTTLNVVGPNLFDNDEKKLENLRKLMRSLENTIGIDPYEIKQIVAGIKLPSPDEKDLFENMDLTLIFRTANSNDSMLESWSKKMDLIQAFELEKKPTEKYIEAFREYRAHEINEEEAKTLAIFIKEFDEIFAKANILKDALNALPASTKSTKAFKDSANKNKALIELIVKCQALLKTDTNVKTLTNDSIRLQNRWTETTLDDPDKTAKLAKILTEAKAIYPRFRSRAEEVAKADAVINLSEYAFYELMIEPETASDQFSAVDDEDEGFKAPNDELISKLDEVIAEIKKIPTARFAQTKKLSESFKTLTNLEEIMKIRLSPADELEPLAEVMDEKTTQQKSGKSFSETLSETAKISQVNGKRMISIDPEKVDLWNAVPGDASDAGKSDPAIIRDQKKTDKEPESKAAVKAAKITGNSKEKYDIADSKKEHIAIGYIDSTTMVMGYESGIRSILGRKEGYRNPKAAEMISSFKSPLISFASNSVIINGLLKGIETLEADENKGTKKKTDPVETFFSDINIFGAVEYEKVGDSNDIVMSLGFTKNSVEELFAPDLPEGDDTVIEIGDYQLGEALFYDLLNTLKAYKASMSFKFEKKKLAALIEKVPEIIENAKAKKGMKTDKSKVQEKIRVRSFEDVLMSPKFYSDLADFFLKRKR